MQVTETRAVVRGLRVFEVQRTCVYDGPGLRTTIFFQGCSLRCLWCQNPEGQNLASGSEHLANPGDLMEVILRDKKFFESTGGGVTLSGGEPLLQDPEALVQFLEMLKAEGIHVTAETALNVPWENVERVLSLVDLFLVDLKVVGDDALHFELTKRHDDIIRANVGKLLASGANVKFRMVVVPGYNDGKTNIRATADFLKASGHVSIELLKYHNLYEEKAQRLGLEVPTLGITPEQGQEAVLRGVELFRSFGIEAEYVDRDAPRREAAFTERVKKIQGAIRKSQRAICIESLKLKTKYYKKNGFKRPTPIHRAGCLSYMLRNKTIRVYPGELLVGNYTSKRVAGQIWIEYMGIVGAKMVSKFGKLKPVSFEISLDEGFAFLKAIPFWLKRGLLGRVYTRIPDIIRGFARTSELVTGFNNNFAAIAHFIVNFERFLSLGTTGLKAEVETTRREHPENNQDFYEGVLVAIDALEHFGARYAEHLAELAAAEGDHARRVELETMAEVCRRVPKFPARTFHEALQSMLFLHLALCTESYENAISFGRLDQILYPYFKRDLEEGRITREGAKELLALFILKMDEVILANDGDTFMELFRLFETMSTDQAVTFGGVDRDGKDATNDLTYMLIDICELQPYCADMGARIHENSPDEYLERLAEVYINGTPIPQLFSDDIYIKAILKHYPTTLEDARNYSIVGCVEPNASDDHFGNTDCANVNLAIPLLQALKGHDHDLWNYGTGEALLKLSTDFVKFTFKGKGRVSRFVRRACDYLVKRHDVKKGMYVYDPPTSMEELLERFQTRLNALTGAILADHQAIERQLRTHFTTPLASSLSRGCLERGKDLYEGGAKFNSSGIQAVAVTDVADSLHAIEEVVFRKKLYTMREVIDAIESNFRGEFNRQVRAALLAVPKFGDDSSPEASEWVSRVMGMYNAALESVPNCPRNGRYSAGYYALNVATVYGTHTPALPSGRLAGVPLANSIAPHYGMEESNLFSALNSLARVDFVEHAENGTTATLTIDSSLFQGREGARKLAGIFKTYLTNGGMQLQPNVVNRQVLLDAYAHPEKYPNLMVRIAGYCAYFNELSDEMKRTVINRTCYA
ncbi:MAG: pyruvate formate lyase family protein [Promethearchaeota archaeon]